MGDGGNIIYVNTKDKIVVSSSALFVPKVRDRIDLIKTYIEQIFRWTENKLAIQGILR